MTPNTVHVPLPGRSRVQGVCETSRWEHWATFTGCRLCE